MEWIAKVKRMVKLGLFVGAGTLAAVASACSGRSTPADTGADGEVTAHDMGTSDHPADAGPPDGPRLDGNAPADTQAGWDLPLE